MLYFYNSNNLNDLEYKNFIFLAGPTDRNMTYSWRKEFLNLFKSKDNYDIFIPEYSNENDTRLKQFEIYALERRLLKMAWMTVFWIDRSLDDCRLGLTTNIEFGNFASHHKNICLCGAPKYADKIDYIKYVWETEENGVWYTNMTDMINKISTYKPGN